ncbi:MAG: histidine phosphatase family protein [Gallionella sp.]
MLQVIDNKRIKLTCGFYEPRGRAFESLRAHQRIHGLDRKQSNPFFFSGAHRYTHGYTDNLLSIERGAEISNIKIFLVRHGESEANVANRINDDPTRLVNITRRGRAQAEAAAERLRGVPFTYAYASEFPRAQQTAEILLRHHDLQLTIDARLNERRSGMDGLPVDAFNDAVKHDLLRYKPARGESFLEQMERLRSFQDEISIRHLNETVLAVSHENPIVAALASTVVDPEKVIGESIANCEWMELDWPVP